MRVHVLQHVPFEGLGSMECWLAERGATIGYTRFYEGAALPDPGTFDLVIAMGGPMSVNDEGAYAWLQAEKRFLREAIEQGLPVVGVCLGAQLIASALGARVYANAMKEIGWFPIQAAGTAGEVFRFPREIPVFHWHGETFDLPKGAVRLARSAACENQAFQVGGNTIGLQFHLETTRESAGLMVQNCGDELREGAWIQPAEEIRAVPDATYARINGLMGEVLKYVTRSGV